MTPERAKLLAQKFSPRAVMSDEEAAELLKIAADYFEIEKLLGIAQRHLTDAARAHQPDADSHGHLVGGEFQSDKYPSTPRGKVPLSVKDRSAQDLLWTYAERHEAVDAGFSTDLRRALLKEGYEAP